MPLSSQGTEVVEESGLMKKPFFEDESHSGDTYDDTSNTYDDADGKELALTIERLQDLHGSLIARPSENEKAEDPMGLKIQLMLHQQYALAWLLWREQQKPSGGVLADGMGLGKTLTMIALIMTTLDDESDNDNKNDNNKSDDSDDE